MFVNGGMEKPQKEPVCFCIGKGTFNKLHILVDGICSTQTKFVKAIKEPASEREKALTLVQEAARKDKPIVGAIVWTLPCIKNGM